jgi:CMP-2-keto-3-deoxyoctulosonic acid synthetase
MSIKSMNQEWPNRWSNCEDLDVDVVVNDAGDEPFMPEYWESNLKSLKQDVDNKGRLLLWWEITNKDDINNPNHVSSCRSK